MTRKEFVVQIVNDLKENPKAILRGHGLRPNFLETLTTRDDILGKIAGFAFSTKLAVKGKKALRKQNNMRVFAYKDFLMFNSKSRNDVQTFMEGLAPEDQNTFTNANNILVILALPDNGDAGSTEGNISLGKSVMLSFDSAVKKEYKVPGGMYYVIMFGDSVIRPVEAKKAAAKEVVNERKVRIASSPAKLKNQLVKKAKDKMNKINNANRRLKGKASLLGAELSQVSAYARQLGLDDSSSKVSDLTAADRAFNKRTTAGSGVLKSARIDEHNRAINTIRMKNRYLVQDLQNAATPRERANIRFAIKQNQAKIEEFKARIGLYDNLDARTIKNKAKVLANINAEIEANLAAGQTITSSLNAALAKLNVSNQQKQQIAQQVIEEIADNGTDLQLAAQQVLQQMPIEQLPMQQAMPQVDVKAPIARKAPRRKTRSIEEILNSPVEPLISGDLVGDEFSDGFVSQKAPQFSRSQEIKDVVSFI